MAAGWVIQDKKRLNLYASLGVAVREMDTDAGPADYMPKSLPNRQWSTSALPQGPRCPARVEGRGEGINTQIMQWVPKTLIFAKDDDHCDRIGDAVREVFDEGNAFCKKITYKVGKNTAEESIKAFCTDPQHRIAVTVTGAQRRKYLMKPEGVLKGKSLAYYEQMKGRGTRVISIDDEYDRCGSNMRHWQMDKLQNRKHIIRKTNHHGI